MHMSNMQAGSRTHEHPKHTRCHARPCMAAGQARNKGRRARCLHAKRGTQQGARDTHLGPLLHGLPNLLELREVVLELLRAIRLVRLHVQPVLVGRQLLVELLALRLGADLQAARARQARVQTIRADWQNSTGQIPARWTCMQAGAMPY